MNVIDFLAATADYLVTDRPDIYDKETAVEELSCAMDALREYDDKPVATMSFSSYLLTRIVEEEGLEEFILSRKVASLGLFLPEEDCRAYSHIEGINLPHVLLDEDFEF